MQIVDIKISRHIDLKRGILIKEKEGIDYVVLVNNPVDYVLDGVSIINKKYLKKVFELDKNEFAYKIFELKNKLIESFLFKMQPDISNFLIDIKNKALLVELVLDSNEYCLIGKIEEITDNFILLNLLSVKGEYLGLEKIKLSRIRIITLNTDYINSLTDYINSRNK